MDSAALIKRLRRDGWRLHSVRGSHHHFTHPEKPGRATVPHPRKDLMVDTLRSLFRQAGWNWRNR